MVIPGRRAANPESITTMDSGFADFIRAPE
jgi:hypothetical protein